MTQFLTQAWNSDITTNFLILVGGFLVLTRRLVWYKDLSKTEKELEDWKKLALRLLGATENITKQTEIITTRVLPQVEEDSRKPNEPIS